GVAGGPVAFGDYDNDGDMDLYMSGTTDGTNFISRIYRKGAGLNAFSDIAAGIPGVVYGSGAWGDCDGDGDLDLVMTGIGAGTNAKIWRNSGGANPTF